MAKDDKKSIDDLELHEETYIKPGVKAMRVPEGLIYTHIHSFNENMKTLSQSISTTFVPYKFKKGTTFKTIPKKPKGLNLGG